MSKRNSSFIVLNLILLIISTKLVYSWGATGHKIINCKAVMHLPSEMKSFIFEIHSNSLVDSIIVADNYA